MLPKDIKLIIDKTSCYKLLEMKHDVDTYILTTELINGTMEMLDKHRKIKKEELSSMLTKKLSKIVYDKSTKKLLSTIPNIEDNLFYNVLSNNSLLEYYLHKMSQIAMIEKENRDLHLQLQNTKNRLEMIIAQYTR